MSAPIPIRVLDDEAWREWQQAGSDVAENPAHGRRTKVAEQGWAPIIFRDNGRMSWTCPGCGTTAGGQLGSEPVSGWDEPRWVLSGPPDAPSLTPSLGCWMWREGHCEGHYWLRDGMLVSA